MTDTYRPEDDATLRPAYAGDVVEGGRIAFRLPVLVDGVAGVAVYAGVAVDVVRVTDVLPRPHVEFRLSGDDRVFRVSPNLHAWLPR